MLLLEACVFRICSAVDVTEGPFRQTSLTFDHFEAAALFTVGMEHCRAACSRDHAAVCIDAGSPSTVAWDLGWRFSS